MEIKSKEVEIRELVNQVAIIKSSEFSDAKREFEENVEKQKQIAGRISVPALIESLQNLAVKVQILPKFGFNSVLPRIIIVLLFYQQQFSEILDNLCWGVEFRRMMNLKNLRIG